MIFVFQQVHEHRYYNLSCALAERMIELAEESGRDIIVDGSLFGMGRGAGNAKTELLADYVNKHCGGHYDLQKLLETIDKYIMPILPEIHWGYDLPMYVCGTKHSHVDNVYHLKKAYDKYSTLKDIVGEENIGSCAYFGDDVLDQKCMIPIRDAGGIVGCPSDAVQEVKAISDYTCLQKAGEGALREFAEWLVSDKNDSIEERVKSAVEYLMNLSDDQLSCGKHEVREYPSFQYILYPVSQPLRSP